VVKLVDILDEIDRICILGEDKEKKSYREKRKDEN
jgi:hypothetical protein